MKKLPMHPLQTVLPSSPIDATQTAKTFGCTEAQAIAQMRKNLAGLETDAAKAKSTGRKVNSYTYDDLMHMIAKVKRGWNL